MYRIWLYYLHIKIAPLYPIQLSISYFYKSKYFDNMLYNIYKYI